MRPGVVGKNVIEVRSPVKVNLFAPRFSLAAMTAVWFSVMLSSVVPYTAAPSRMLEPEVHAYTHKYVYAYGSASTSRSRRGLYATFFALLTVFAIRPDCRLHERPADPRIDRRGTGDAQSRGKNNPATRGLKDRCSDPAGAYSHVLPATDAALAAPVAPRRRVFNDRSIDSTSTVDDREYARGLMVALTRAGSGKPRRGNCAVPARVTAGMLCVMFGVRPPPRRVFLSHTAELRRFPRVGRSWRRRSRR